MTTNLRFHPDVDDATLVHGTYWGLPNAYTVPGYGRTRRLACDDSPIAMMTHIFEPTDDMVTCLVCLAQMR